MRPRRLPAWLLLALVTAAVLPLVLFIALQAAFSAETERSNLEQAAVDRARRIMTAVDAHLERTRGAAGALITTRSVLQADWPAAFQRAKEITDQNPEWDAAIIWDRFTRRELVNTSHGPERGIPVQDLGANPSRLRQPTDLLVGDVVLKGERCPCLYAHTAAGPRLPYILSIRLHPSAFRQAIETEGQDALGSTLVDANGLMIASSGDGQTSIGQRGSAMIRSAIANGRSGIYKGGERQGVPIIRAFWTSSLSNWSVHLALNAERFEGPRLRWAAASTIAALASLIVAGAIVALALRNFAAHRRFEEQATHALRAEAAAQLLVARDLHDGVLQFLTGLSMRLRGLRLSVADSEGDRNTDEAFEALEGEVRREQRELRRFIENLGPKLRSADPQASISAIAGMLARRWAVRVHVVPDEPDAIVPEELRRDVEFILREAVSNAVRHGGAENIEISFARAGADLAIVIKDDGSGFPSQFTESASAAEPGPLPATIYGRVVQHGGSMEIGNEGGAVVTLRLPEQ